MVGTQEWSQWTSATSRLNWGRRGREHFLRIVEALVVFFKKMFLLSPIFPGRFESVPKPMVDPLNSYGVHPVVCCPKYLPDSSICFESDPWCATYVQPEYEYEEGDIPEGGDYPGYDEDYPPDGGDYAGYDYSLGELPKVSERSLDKT